MGYDYGRFVWFELITTDIERAKGFYGEVIGWKTETVTMPGFDYQMIKVGDAGVGAFLPPPVEGMPTHWLSYVSVADVDVTAKKIVAAGGKCLGEAIDIANVGRLQPVSDPQGGVFCLFHGANGDAPPVKGPGSFHWNELWTKDDAAALRFYQDIFGYEHDAMDMPQGKYHVLKTEDGHACGMMKTPMPEAPTAWVQYIEVDDCDAAVARAKQHGATVHVPPMDTPDVGRHGLIQDPFGAVIGLIKPIAR